MSLFNFRYSLAQTTSFASWALPARVKTFSTLPKSHLSLSIQTLNKSEYGKNTSLYNSLIEVARPSYQNPYAVLSKDWDHCDRLYLGYQGTELACFFMVGKEQLQLKDRPTPSIYLGLGCTNQRTKNSGMISQLFTRFISEAHEWQQNEPHPMPLWYTTPTPSTSYRIAQLFKNSQPFVDGTYSSEGLEVVEAVKRKMSWTQNVSQHPFVIKAITDVRYSKEERERIAKITQNKNFRLLDDLGVQETKGDRLIGICYLPDKTVGQ